MTQACTDSKGKQIIGKDNQSQTIINRINSVDKLFCDVTQRLSIARVKLGEYCVLDDPASSSSSSSSACPFAPVVNTPGFFYQINVNDLDDDVYDLIALLEAEACVMLRKLKEYEILNTNCNPSSSSSSSQSSSSSSSGTHSASSSSSSSSSGFVYGSFSSSSSGELTCLTSLHLASYCDGMPGLSLELFPKPSSGIGYGDCEYQGSLYTGSSSSSTSSSSSGLGEVYLRYVIADTKWVIESNSYGVIAERMGEEFEPRGAYSFIYGPCIGESIFVV